MTALIKKKVSPLALAALTFYQFFIWYWGMVFTSIFVAGAFDQGGFAEARKALQDGWSALGDDFWRLEFIVAVGPILAFIFASGVSGVFRVAVAERRLAWARLIAFIVVFWMCDGTALAIGIASPKISPEAMQQWINAIGQLPMIFHVVVAPGISALTSVMVLKFIGGRLES